MPDNPAGAEPQVAVLARSARDRGRVALDAGDVASAVRWLGRAHRLVPADVSIALTLATALLGHDDGMAISLFEEILTRGDVREAWVGLASAWFRTGNFVAAAHAIGRALRRHVPVPGVEPLADGVVRALGLPGWCGLLGSGSATVHPRDGVQVQIDIDGCAVPAPCPPVDWVTVRVVAITAGGTHLLGSPIDVAAIGQVVGYVEPWNGGLRGWAAHPNDPITDPVLRVLDAAGGVSRRIRCAGDAAGITGDNGLLVPRAFRLTRAQLGRFAGPFRVIGRDGRDVAGSPLDPTALERVAPVPVGPTVARRVMGDPGRRRPVAVVIPVIETLSPILACLDSVLAGGGTTTVVVVVGALDDPALVAGLRCPTRAGRVEIHVHDRPLGIAACLNTGIAAHPDCDIVLLGGDTRVPPRWLERLTNAAYEAPDVGTVTPLSQRVGPLAYASREDLSVLDRLAQRANRGHAIEIPSGLEFCLFLKRDCLDDVGPFNTALFAQGQGAAIDFCLRARRRGWRHMALTGLFISRLTDMAPAPAGPFLRSRNDSLLEQLHPGYAALVRIFETSKPLMEVRRRIDVARWRASASHGLKAVILITHADGGGVEQRIRIAAAACRAAGLRPIVLRPVTMADGRQGVLAGEGPDGDFPYLRYVLPEEMPELLRLLRGARPERVEVHHMLGHHPAMYDVVRRLRRPYDVHVHDYAWICPRISLMGGENRYCGEPELAACEACVARNGPLTGEDLGVGALRRRSAAFFSKANRVIAPSRDAASRIRRYYPSQAVSIVPHGDDTDLPDLKRSDGIVRICVLGGIGPHKGFEVLLACARDAAERGLDLEYVVVGDTTGDEALLATGRAFITGTYQADEAVSLVRAQAATFGFIPSVWPETWSLTLGELWQAGLPVVAFDLGAPAERIRATGRGLVLPLGLPAGAINDALLAAARRFRQASL